MTDLKERLRNHVRDRGGLSKDRDGKIVIQNGAWQMMLDAAAEIEGLERQIAKLTAPVTMKEARKFIDLQSNKEIRAALAKDDGAKGGEAK